MFLLILNFFYFSFFTIFIFQIGNYLAFKLKNKIIDQYKSLNFFLGIFLSGNVIVILNFILPTGSYLTFLLLFIFFALSYKCKIYYKYIFKIILINLIVYPVCLKMSFEYDSGLYHFPYQNILRNEKIIFGIANIMRFGYSSLQDYLGSVIWHQNFIFHKFLIGSFLSFFLLFLDDLRKTKLNLDNIYFYYALLSLPFLSRYFSIYATLNDFSSGVVILLQFYFAIKIFLLPNKKEDDSDNIQILFILSYLSLTLKASGSLTLILFFLTIIFSVKSYDFLKSIFSRNVILLVLAFAWILKNIIISGCIIYPISFSCFSFFDWNAATQAEQDTLGTLSMSRQPFAGIEETIFSNNWFFNYWIKTYDKFILSTVFLLFFIFIVNFIFFYFKSKKALSFFYVLFPLIAIFIFQTETFFLVEKLFNFYLFLTLAILCLFFTFIIIYNYYERISKNISKNYQFLAVFIFYLLLSILIWFYKAPNPRFGFGYFFCLFIYFGFMLQILFNNHLNIFNLSNKYEGTKKIILYSFIIIIFSQTGPTSTHYSVYNFFNNSFFTKKLNSNYFEKNNIHEVEIKKRENFGFKPLNTDQCWLNLYCYPDSEDVKLYNMKFNYKKFKKMKLDYYDN